MGVELGTGDPADELVPEQTTRPIAAFPLNERRADFKLLIDKESPKRFTSTFKRLKDQTWSLNVEDLREIQFRASNGRVMVTRDVDVKENVRVDYDPPLEFLKPSLAKNQPINGESTMIVRNRKTGSIRDQGTCVYQVTLVGKKQIDTELGKLDVQHIRMTRKIKLNLAQVDITIDQLRHATFGLIRSYTVRQTKALGLFGSTTTEDMVLLKYQAIETNESNSSRRGTEKESE